MKYKFWSIYIPNNSREKFKGHWELIPPSKDYLPKGYDEKYVRKHEDELLPPPSYWLKPEYEDIVYNTQ